MRNTKKKAFAVILSLLFGSPIIASCAPETSSIAPHECVFYDVEAVTPTCLHGGNIAYKQCPYCKKIEVNGEVKTLEEVSLPIDPANHEQLRSVDEVPATCIQDGTKAYQYCDACGSYVLDGTNYTDETIGDLLVLHKEDAEHDLVHYAQMNPTCIPGMKEHDICKICHKYFVAGKEVSKEDLAIAPVEEHLFGPSGNCVNGCESYRYPNVDGGQVFEPENKVPLLATAGEGWCDTGSDKDEMIASTHANKMTFHTQRGSSDGSVDVEYDPNGSDINIRFSGSSTANNSFTRFAPGEDGTAYTGRLSLAFDLTVGAGVAISRIGAKVVDYGGDAFPGQDKLLGFNSAEENNPDRKLEAGVTYRFVYDMEVTNKNADGEDEEQLIQIWACGGASSFTISNLRYVERPDLEKTGTVQSHLLYFGKAKDMSLNEKDILANEITLDQTAMSLVKGQSKKIEVTAIKPENTTDKTVSWASSNEKVATVDENGNVTAVGVGTATITAKVGLATTTCTVTVTEEAIPVESVSLDKDTLELIVGGQPEKLSATILPENATDKSVTWTSSDEKVATVDQTGLVTPVGEGEATITVTTKDGQKSDSCKVTVLQGDKSYYLYNGKDFFDSSSWYDTTSAATPRDESIIDEKGNLVFTKNTQSRIDLFHCAEKDGSYLHYGDAANKSGIDQVVGKSTTYTMALKATSSFQLMILGVKGAYGPSTSGAAAHYLRITEDGKVSLDLTGPDSDHFTNRFTADSSFKMNEENTLSITLTRVSKDALTIAIAINGEDVVLKGETFEGDRGTYSVDENGVLTNTYPSSNSGMGQRFGVYPEGDSVVTISGLSIINN